jgi:hypothetical protein
MSESDDVRDDVVRRAGERCEYCRMHQSLQGARFHMEHIVPRSGGGETVSGNLAWACPSCNLHKSDRVLVADPDSSEFVPMFNPRVDDWFQHFDWSGYRVLGKSQIGRATISALHMNSERRLRIREVEDRFGLFPPPDSLLADR